VSCLDIKQTFPFRIPEPSMTGIVIGKTIKLSFYALTLFGAYKLSRRLFDFPSNSSMQTVLEKIPAIASLPMKYIKSG